MYLRPAMKGRICRQAMNIYRESMRLHLEIGNVVLYLKHAADNEDGHTERAIFPSVLNIYMK